MNTALIVAVLAAFIAGFAKSKIKDELRAHSKWCRFFQAGSIRRM